MVWETCNIFIPRTGLITSVQSIEIFASIFIFVSIISFFFSPGGLAWSLSKSLRNNKPTSAAIPGPSGLPLIGSALAFAGSKAHRTLASLALAHRAKPLMAFSVGFTRFVVSSSPETAKELLNNTSFADRPVKESAYGLLFHRAMGFAPFGDYWRNLRRISGAHLFSPKRIASFGAFRRDICLKMVEEVKAVMENDGEVQVREILRFGSLNNVMMSVFGKKYNFGGGGEEVDGLVKEGYELLGMFNWGDHFPLVGWLDLQGVRRRCKKLVVKVNEFVGKIVEEHRARREGGGTDNSDESGDFVDVLLDLEKENGFTHSDMVAVLWVGFIIICQIFFWLIRF